MLTCMHNSYNVHIYCHVSTVSVPRALALLGAGDPDKRTLFSPKKLFSPVAGGQLNVGLCHWARGTRLQL